MDWESVSRALEVAYGNPRHGNPEDPVECLIYLMLSRKTPIAVAGRMLKRLEVLVGHDWNRLPEISEKDLAATLHGSGLEEIRAHQIHLVAVTLRERFGRITLDPLRNWSDDACFRFLTELPGVGAKTALCVMMYTLGRQVFPADAHCIRILKRMGVIPEHLEHRPAQRLLAKLVPGEFAYKLHVNLVAHGQAVCRAVDPQCDQCVIRQYCRGGSIYSLRTAENVAQFSCAQDG